MGTHHVRHFLWTSSELEDCGALQLTRTLSLSLRRDFRNPAVVDYWAQSVAGGAVQNDFVDGIFTDDPAGYGQEHPSIRQRSTNPHGFMVSVLCLTGPCRY